MATKALWFPGKARARKTQRPNPHDQRPNLTDPFPLQHRSKHQLLNSRVLRLTQEYSQDILRPWSKLTVSRTDLEHVGRWLR